MTGRALLGLALLTGLASAAPVEQRVLAQPAVLDSAPKPAAPDPAPGAARDSIPYRPAKSTGTAVLLSLVLPGGGQVYTGNWWKAALIAPAELTLGYFSVREHMAAMKADQQRDTVSYVRHRDTRTAFLWWTGAVIAFSMADAPRREQLRRRL